MTPAFGWCLGDGAGDFGNGGRLGGKLGRPGGFRDGVEGIPKPKRREEKKLNFETHKRNSNHLQL